MRVQSFEDLVAWQKARVLARLVYDMTRRREFGRDYALAGQMQRAASSVMANIAEGFDREGPTEFHRFVSIARASCAELLSHVYLAHDIGYIADEEFRAISDSIAEERRILRALRASLERAKRS
jgi:four helix bundle protein